MDEEHPKTPEDVKALVAERALVVAHHLHVGLDHVPRGARGVLVAVAARKHDDGDARRRGAVHREAPAGAPAASSATS